MRFTSAVCTALLLAVCCSSAMAQQQDADFAVHAAYRAKVVEGVAQKLGDGYFDAEIASTLRSRFENRSVQAELDTCSTARSLSTVLTRDLQAWTHDRHVQVVFSVDPLPMPAAGNAANANVEAENMARRNFGFYALTRFTGNVGYIELGHFAPAALAGPTLQAVMQFVANTDALIIDLRQNGGGHADMVALMTSYFIDEQTKLATLERRDKSESSEIWSASYVPGPKYVGKPVFVLTSKRTFSAAEGLTYDLRHFAHATVVGENTRGGANPGAFQMIDDHFAVFVPTARVIHAATGTNWDAVGITPDVPVAAKDASHTALKLALEALMVGNPSSPRMAMWKEAYDDMFAATATK